MRIPIIFNVEAASSQNEGCGRAVRVGGVSATTVPGKRIERSAHSAIPGARASAEQRQQQQRPGGGGTSTHRGCRAQAGLTHERHAALGRHITGRTGEKVVSMLNRRTRAG